jgi:hypothetical protein
VGGQAPRTSTSFASEGTRRADVSPGGPQRPEDTLANLEVHPDFTLKLVASEPLITKPMNFDWDPAGGIWVAESPNIRMPPAGMRPDIAARSGKDHGGIRPDTRRSRARGARQNQQAHPTPDGDGVMDKKEVFYEGLDLVTGLVFHQDGVIVTQAPDIPLAARLLMPTARRQSREALRRPRHRRHARGHQQPTLGLGRLDLRHARIQPVRTKS